MRIRPLVLAENQDGKLQSGYQPMPSNLAYAEGFYATQVMPMVVVRPAPPSAVIGFYSPDYYGYVGRETQIRITAQGGRYPYNVVVDEAPSGATISNDPSDKQNYLVLKFTPTANGTSQISLRLYDATGAEMRRIRHTFTTSEDWCVFADPAGVNSPGNGSFASPFKSIHYARNNTVGGKALILKNGTYTDTELGVTLSSSSINSILAWESRQAIIDLASNVQTSPAILFYMNSSNMLAQGIVVRNPQNLVTSPRIFSGDSATNYVYQDDCLFEINGRLGTVNGDNVSAFFMGLTPRHSVAQTRCEISGLAYSSNGWSINDWYDISNGVSECNTILTQSTDYTGAVGIIWLKGTGCRNIDLKNNEFSAPMNGALISAMMSNIYELDDYTGNTDVSFNLVRAKDTGGIWVAQGSQNGRRLPVWTRRNTIVDGAIYIQTYSLTSTYEVTFSSDSDVVQKNISTTDPFKVFVRFDGGNRPIADRPSLTASVTNYECHVNSGAVDSDGNLIGAYIQYEGVRGHKILRS